MNRYQIVATAAGVAFGLSPRLPRRKLLRRLRAGLDRELPGWRAWLLKDPKFYNLALVVRGFGAVKEVCLFSRPEAVTGPTDETAGVAA